MEKVDTFFAFADDDYGRISPDHARELIRMGEGRLPSDRVTLIENEGRVYAADAGTLGAISYTVMTYRGGSKVGRFNVYVPEGAAFDHAYVMPAGAAGEDA